MQDATAEPPQLDPLFWAKVDVGHPLGCWLWTAATNASGYGTLGRSRDGVFKSHLAHRYAYEQLVGAIPNDLQIDHLCRVRRCVNPDHLEPVTSAENQRRGANPTMLATRRNACKHGHEFTPENTYRYETDGICYRRCRRCLAHAARRYQERKQSA